MYYSLQYTLQSVRQSIMMNVEYVCPDSMINGEYVLSYSALYSAIHNVYMMNAEYLYSPLLSALYSAVSHASMMNAEYVCPDSMINAEYVLSYSALYFECRVCMS